MSVINSVALLMGDEGYQISRSVRLRLSASGYLNRTNSGTGSNTAATISLWVKRGALGANQTLFGCERSAASDGFTLWFDSSDKLNWGINASSGATNGSLVTTQVFRDPSAWYHIVAAVDTSLSTAGDRMRLYVNGVEVTAFTTDTNPTQNSTIWLGTSGLITMIGRVTSSPTWFLDGYLAEYNVINGQQLTPSSFGETDAVTGVWKPKKYAGTYGTNGFYLNFSDNSAATAAAIGKDYSGNGNNWTPNNISVTSGVTYDSMLDVPTPYADGGNGRGNYAVLNPLNTTVNLSNGNLTTGTGIGAAAFDAIGNIAVTTGKWYWEITHVSIAALAQTGFWLSSYRAGRAVSSGDRFVTYASDGNRYVESTSATSGWASYTSNDVIGVALDMDTSSASFYKNGLLQGSVSFTSGQEHVAFFRQSNSASHFNFGQRPFAYTPPTGFKALNTQNLPDPTIKKGNQYFNATIYTGTGSSQSITNAGSMQPDLVWVKGRSGATDHALYDAVRGAQAQLESNTTTAETTESTGLTAFNSNGFTVGALAQMNTNAATYVGWQWKEGATQGFDIVTYTGTGGSGIRSVSHSLGVAPKMVIVKDRGAASTGTSHWPVMHTSLAAGSFLLLSLTNAAAAASNYFGNAYPTSSVFYVGGDASNVSNESGHNYVAYLFSEVAGFSKFGSYTGNGSADGPFVYCGFRPRFIMSKRTDSTSSWTIVDTARSAANVATHRVYAEASSAEDTADTPFDVLSNGFKLRSSNVTQNASGGTYIYAAFAENPFKYSLAR